MDEVALCGEEILVSFDVKSFFTSIPVDEAIRICEERLKGDDTLEKRTKWMLERLWHCCNSVWSRRNLCTVGSIIQATWWGGNRIASVPSCSRHFHGRVGEESFSRTSGTTKNLASVRRWCHVRDQQLRWGIVVGPSEWAASTNNVHNGTGKWGEDACRSWTYCSKEVRKINWTEPCTESQHTWVDASPLIATTQRRSNVELFEGLLREQSRFAVTKNQRRGKSGTSWEKCKEMAFSHVTSWFLWHWPISGVVLRAGNSSLEWARF